jgi:predicted acetyltransferase
MDTVEIRAPREEEFPEIIALDALAFGEEVSPEDEAVYRRTFPFDRALCAYDSGKMVAVSALLSLELTLPGGAALPAAGVTWIATLPTHRRRGLLRSLMAAQFEGIAARGEPLSALFASEGAIYGRYGYGAATRIASFTVDLARADLTASVADTCGGRLMLLDDGEAAARLPAIYESLRLAQPGAVNRPPDWWTVHLYDPVSEREGAGRMHHAVYESAPGVAEGYVSYRLKEKWDGYVPAGEVKVVEVQAASLTAYTALWEYVLRTDLCQTASCWRGRTDEPLRWLLAEPRSFAVNAWADDLYVRVHDVVRALAARTYAAEGDLVLEVVQTFPHESSERFLLSAGAPGSGAAGTRATCVRTARSPDLVLGIDSLGAVLLGGIAYGTLAAAGLVHEAVDGAARRADAMFRTSPAPHCSTMF